MAKKFHKRRVRPGQESIDCPEVDMEKLGIADLIDAHAIQLLMDNFYKLAHVPMSIVDLEGKLLVGVGWQDICTKFHRVHPEACKHCVESDRNLTMNIPRGEFRLYKCKNGMWDIATPIMIGSCHVGNLFSGQFFFEDETLDYDFFRSQAGKYDFDEREYLEALESVPRLSRDVVNTAMEFFIKLADMISELSYGNIGMTRLLAERDSLMRSLQESETRLRLTTTAANEAIWDWDIADNKFTWNETYSELFGRTPEEGSSSRWFVEHIHPDDRARIKAQVRQAIKSEYNRFIMEYRFLRRDGGYADIYDRALIARDESGKARRIVGAQLDITERKRAEENLSASKKQIETVLGSITDMYVSYDKDWRYIDLNPAAERAIGRTKDELLGKVLWEVFPQLRASEIYNGYLLVESTRKPAHFESYSPVTRLWQEFHVYPVENGYNAYIRDISSRKQAEEALRRNESLLRTITDNSPDPIFMKDISGRMMMANPATLAAIGKPAEEVIGKTDEEFYDDPEIGRAMMENDRRIMDSRKAEVFEETISCPGGRRIYLSTKTPLYDQNGKIIGLIGIARDITERKQMEEALQRAKDELEIKVQERTRKLAKANKTLLAEIEARWHIAEELRKSEEAYRLLVELNLVGVFRRVYDPVTMKTARLHCNEAQLRILGYRSLDEYLKDDPAEQFRFMEDWNTYMKLLQHHNKVVNLPVQLKRKDGRIIWVLLNSTARPYHGKILVEGAMTDITEQKRTEERLRSAQKKLRAMASEIVLADERSRQHFATDLHDTVVQTLGAAKLRSEVLREYVSEEGIGFYTEMQKMILQSIAQARIIMMEMSPPVLYELGFIPALEWLSEHMEQQHGIVVKFESKIKAGPIAREIQVLLFQAVRELLMNIVKHAKAKNALVKASSVGEKVRIEVIDDGIGFDKRQAFRSDIHGGGFGLFSIRERLRHFGGHLLIRSKPGQGASLIVTAPRSANGLHDQSTLPQDSARNNKKG
jgi:PAS domain S-box-containing protein